MRLEIKCLIIAVVAIVLAIPLAIHDRNRNHQIKVEQTQSQQLRLELETKQKELDTKDQQIKDQETKQQELEQQLQAKRDAQLAAAKAQETALIAIGKGNCEPYRSIIAQYSWNVDTAMNVCHIESGGNPNAANWADGHDDMGCSGSFGLFQINCGHGQVFDPAQNVAIAFSMWQASGWQPWSFTTCRLIVCS